VAFFAANKDVHIYLSAFGSIICAMERDRFTCTQWGRNRSKHAKRCRLCTMRRTDKRSH